MGRVSQVLISLHPCRPQHRHPTLPIYRSATGPGELAPAAIKELQTLISFLENGVKSSPLYTWISGDMN